MACGINVRLSQSTNLFIVTGGQTQVGLSKRDVVAYYQYDQLPIALPKLQTGRYRHACGQYVNSKGDQVKIK